MSSINCNYSFKLNFPIAKNLSSLQNSKVSKAALFFKEAILSVFRNLILHRMISDYS